MPDNTIIWMPYIRFQCDNNGNGEAIAIPPVILRHDTDKTRKALNIIGHDFFNIFRNLPDDHSSTIGYPCRGTFITPDSNYPESNAWLHANFRNLIAVLYYLGDRTIPNNIFVIGGDAKEKFYSIPISIRYGTQKDGSDNNMIAIKTKHGMHWNCDTSIKFTPSISLYRQIRNDHNTKEALPIPYIIGLNSTESIKLVNILYNEPYSRIIKSCFHFFQAQTDDIFSHPLEEDFVNYTSCIEAITEMPEVGIYKALADKLQCIYGNSTDIANLVYGLYASRSLYAHGNTVTPLSNNDWRYIHYDSFCKRRNNEKLIRELCKDLINKSIGKAQDPTAQSSFEYLLKQSLNSNSILRRIIKRACKKSSIDNILALSGDALCKFHGEIELLMTEFHWEFLSPVPSIDKLIYVLCVYAIALKNLLDGKNIPSILKFMLDYCYHHSLDHDRHKKDRDALLELSERFYIDVISWSMTWEKALLSEQIDGLNVDRFLVKPELSSEVSLINCMECVFYKLVLGFNIDFQSRRGIIML